MTHLKTRANIVVFAGSVPHDGKQVAVISYVLKGEVVPLRRRQRVHLDIGVGPRPQSNYPALGGRRTSEPGIAKNSIPKGAVSQTRLPVFLHSGSQKFTWKVRNFIGR